MTERDIYKIIYETVANLSNKTPVKHILDFALATDIANACIKKSEEMNLQTTISICDAHGNMILFYRMDHSLLISSEIAPNKAYTSVALNMSTTEAKQFMDMYAPHLDIATQRRLVFFAGGLPIRINKKLVGGLGISGGLPNQDEEIANYGLKSVLY